jgi:hypothetical protein
MKWEMKWIRKGKRKNKKKMMMRRRRKKTKTLDFRCQIESK